MNLNHTFRLPLAEIDALRLDPQHFVAPTEFDMDRFQRRAWLSVRSEADLVIPICERLTPWRAIFDFTQLQPADQLAIRLEIEVYGPAPTQKRWLVTEEHLIGIHVDDGVTHLSVNGQPVTRGRILEVAPIEGPWVARMSLAQVRGMSANSRVMVLPHDPATEIAGILLPDSAPPPSRR